MYQGFPYNLNDSPTHLYTHLLCKLLGILCEHNPPVRIVSLVAHQDSVHHVTVLVNLVQPAEMRNMEIGK